MERYSNTQEYSNIIIIIYNIYNNNNNLQYLLTTTNLVKIHSRLVKSWVDHYIWIYWFNISSHQTPCAWSEYAWSDLPKNYPYLCESLPVSGQARMCCLFHSFKMVNVKIEHFLLITKISLAKILFLDHSIQTFFNNLN